MLSAGTGWLVGSWPAGLLVGGLDFYRLHGLLVAGFALGLAGGSPPRRLSWLSGLGVGLLGALSLHLLVVGAEWRFIAVAFEQAAPFIACALAGVVARRFYDRVRVPLQALRHHR